MVRVCSGRIRRLDAGERLDQPQHARAPQLGGRLPRHVCGPRHTRLCDTPGLEINSQRIPRAVSAVDVAIQRQRRNGSLRDRCDPTRHLAKSTRQLTNPDLFHDPNLGCLTGAARDRPRG
ncbi:Uncharacterised protein [Chlamydia trachomatis]|nr:Uncharacterised protein [Chlamydia trachomatis]